MGTSYPLVEKLKILEAVVKAPLYGVVGFAGKLLVYSSTVEGARDLWALDLRTGEKRRLTEGGVHVVAAPRPESHYVIYTKDVSGGRELQSVYAVDARSGESFALEGFEPKRVLGIGFDGKRAALAAAGEGVELWLLEPGGKAEKLYRTDAMMFVTDFADGLVVGQGVLKGNPATYELFIFNVEARQFEVYTPKEGSVNKQPKTKGGLVLFATTAFGGEKLALYKPASGELKPVELPHPDMAEYKPVEYLDFGWTDGEVWAIGKREGRSKLFLAGREVKLPEGSVLDAAFSGSKAYATHSSLTRPTSIYEADLASGGYRLLLGADLPPEVSSRLGRSYMVKVKSFDGVEVPTFVLESAAAPKPGPTVVYVHGGPWSEEADAWSIFVAALAALGYHVVAPNFRGSTGYGEDFRRMDIGDPGGGDLEDVVKTAEWARGEKLASKVAIMGYSYGGFMTFLATVKKPDVFDAGVAGAGIVDWEEMYQLSDAFFRRFIDVLFAGKRELQRDRSATSFAGALKVPLCIIHPQNDTRTPLKPVLKYAMKLLELGKTFELHVLPDAGHAVTKMDDALKLLLPAAIFLEKYLAR